MGSKEGSYKNSLYPKRYLMRFLSKMQTIMQLTMITPESAVIRVAVILVDYKGALSRFYIFTIRQI
jgi:hypothetical protein